MADTYLKFTHTETSESGKTRVYRVDSASDGSELGYVVYYNRWRRYVFKPINRNPIFDEGCLLEIAKFIREQMAEQYKDREARRNERDKQLRIELGDRPDGRRARQKVSGSMSDKVSESVKAPLLQDTPPDPMDYMGDIIGDHLTSTRR